MKKDVLETSTHLKPAISAIEILDLVMPAVALRSTAASSAAASSASPSTAGRGVRASRSLLQTKTTEVRGQHRSGRAEGGSKDCNRAAGRLVRTHLSLFAPTAASTTNRPTTDRRENGRHGEESGPRGSKHGADGGPGGS